MITLWLTGGGAPTALTLALLGERPSSKLVVND